MELRLEIGQTQAPGREGVSTVMQGSFSNNVIARRDLILSSRLKPDFFAHQAFVAIAQTMSAHTDWFAVVLCGRSPPQSRFTRRFKTTLVKRGLTQA